MARLDKLKQTVEDLYHQQLPTRTDWADWLYEQHVKAVTRIAAEIAEKHGADKELAQVGALLHDIADYKLQRREPEHEEESLKTARELMREHEYTDDEIKIVVDDAIRYHSCHNSERPSSNEGLVLATADSLAHLTTDYYLYIARWLGNEVPMDEMKIWVLKKIDRDLNIKISFDDEREAARADYNAIKNLFSK